MPCDKCNFRFEANWEMVVEFFPLECPEPLNGEVTWGEQYVSPGLVDKLCDTEPALISTMFSRNYTSLPALLYATTRRLQWKC